MDSNMLSLLIKSKVSDDITELNESIRKLSNNPNLQRLSLKIQINDSEIQLLSNQIKQFQTQMSKSLDLNVNTTSGNSGLDKFTQKFETIAGEAQKLKQQIYESTNAAGQTVKVIDDLDKETQTVVKSTQLVTDNYKKAREEQEKLIEAMAKGREKSEIKSTKNNNDSELAQAKAINKAKEEEFVLNEKLQKSQTDTIYKQIEKTLNSIYSIKSKLVGLEEGSEKKALQSNLQLEELRFKNLNTRKDSSNLTNQEKEIQLIKLQGDLQGQLHVKEAQFEDEQIQNIKKREEAELSYWSKRRKEATEAITQTNSELQQLNTYYSELEKASSLENKRVFNLGTNRTSDTSGFTGVDKSSAEKYATEIYGANAEVTKFNQTMSKNGQIMSDVTVKVSKNAKEYTEYRLKLDQATQSVNQFGEAVNRKTGKDMGMFEQFQVALQRFPVWINI